MSAFESLFQSFGTPTLLRHFGESGATGFYLLPRDGDPVGPFDWIDGTESDMESESADGREVRRVRTITVPYHADLPFWDGANAIGLILTIGAIAWAVEAVEGLTPTMATVRLLRRGSIEQARPGFRRK